MEIRVGEYSLYSNYLLSSSFIFGVGTPWRVDRNFDTGGNNNHVSTFKYLTPLIFKASSMKRAFVLFSFPEHMSSDFSLQMTSLFLLNWQV